MGDGVRFPKSSGAKIESGGEVRRTDDVHQSDAPGPGAQVNVDADPRARLFRQEPAGGMEIDPAAIGRNALKNGKMLEVFGEQIERLAAPIRVPRGVENAIADLLGGIFANRGPLKDRNIDDHRSEAAARAAVAAPMIAGENALGPLTLYRPGLGNTAPGPAQIARLAQYTEKLVIMYANPGEGAEARLRPINEVDGVPLPPEVRGKVFAMGSPKNLMITYEQASDLFLQQLDSMKRSPHLGGIDLMHAKATVIAHSQGGADSLLTRKRLEEKGFGDVFGQLATLSTPFRGSPVSDENMAGLLTELAGRALDLQSMGAINALDPDYMKKVIREDDQRLVDVSLVGQTESGKAGRGDVRTFFKVSDKAIEAVKSFASLFQGRDVRENDGLVTVSSQLFGARQVKLEKSYDHAGVAEDPVVADVAVKELLAKREAAAAAG